MAKNTRKAFLFKDSLSHYFLIGALLLTVGITSGYSQEIPLTATFDLNNNSVVDKHDLFLFMTLWKASDSAADFDADGTVGAKDLLLFLDGFNSIIEPTPTPTLDVEPTPTSTPTIDVEPPTPTSIPGEDTPTPTATATPTPTIEAPPTPTPTYTPDVATPTPTPTVDPSWTPTPTPVGLFFYTNFDTADSLEDAGMKTLDYTYEDQLIVEDRMPNSNFIEPWFVLNTDQLDPLLERGIALSDPKSAALHPNRYSYNNGQTSVMEIGSPMDTSQAGDPMLSFEAAFIFEEPFINISDFMVIEVKRSGSDTWEILDINNDGKIITDKLAFDENNPQSLLPDTFDGLFAYSNPDNIDGPLTKDDFIPIEVSLPKDAALSIAFRFESDSSINEEGIFIDNIRIFDADSGTGGAPIIRRVYSQDSSDIYVDTENRIIIQGSRLTPIEKVLFTSRDGADVELGFSETADGISVTLPRLSNPTQEDNAVLKVVRSDEASSEPFTFRMNAAPTPVIDTVSPSPFFLNASNSTIRILGKNFRPAFSGATDNGGTSVIIDIGLDDPIKFEFPGEFLKRTENELVFDAAQLKTLSPGLVTISVKNEYSGLENDASNVYNLNLQTGSGDLNVSQFDIELGAGAYLFNPATEDYPLQQDQAFSLLWTVNGVSSNQLNIDISGIPFVVNGEINQIVIAERLAELGRVNESVEGKANVFVGFSGVTLELSPMILSVTGTITAGIRISNGEPVNSTFALNEPQAPILYEDALDWSSQEWSLSSTIYPFDVYGDNFRGLSTFGAEGESISRLELLPVDGGDAIALPEITSTFDIEIAPLIFVDNEVDKDIIHQEISSGYISIPEGETREYRLRVTNPDSGLFVESTKTVTFTP